MSKKRSINYKCECGQEFCYLNAYLSHKSKCYTQFAKIEEKEQNEQSP